jgi:uroporphyrinogen decarboxylase
MTMTSRERMLTALANGRPDRLPCQVHGWMDYYLKHYLSGMDWWQAYERFGMDYAIYVSPAYVYADKNLARWEAKRTELGRDADGNDRWVETITTPKGQLRHAGAVNEITGWETEYLIKTERDFELWDEFCPLPEAADLSPVLAVKERLGDKGIIRSHPFSFGQGSPWQSFCTLVDTEKAIFLAIDEPAFVHHALESILEKTLRVMPMWAGTPADMIEIGGGAGSSTVISPTMFREFCLPYDQRQMGVLHDLDLKVVYHLCGGVMPMLELVVETGADGLETMTPPEMGGNCNLREASRRVGDKLFFIGGFDQNAGFERGTPEKARQLVFDCFGATTDHAGYIVCPSDHFFYGDPANLQAFADAARDCLYS